MGWLVGFDAAPEFLFRGREKMLLERVGRDRDLNPFAAAVIIESAPAALVTHLLCRT
jgi:hypothetical protein